MHVERLLNTHILHELYLLFYPKYDAGSKVMKTRLREFGTRTLEWKPTSVLTCINAIYTSLIIHLLLRFVA